MTLDGYCDHTAMIADDEIHQHYSDLLNDSGLLIYGRITYQLMENYWPDVVKNPTGNKSTDEFAVTIDNITKMVFSRTLQHVTWNKSILKSEINKEEIIELKQSSIGGNKDILVGSPSMIVAFTQLDLVDEYQINVLPIILGKGLPLFKNISDRVDLKLLKTKTFGCGAVLFYYKPTTKTDN